MCLLTGMALSQLLFFGVAQGATQGATTGPLVDDALVLKAFSDPAAQWGSGVEAIIEQAFRECFKTYIIDGRVMTLRLPFAQNNERAELSDSELRIEGGGKAEPERLWTDIDTIIKTLDFKNYLKVLGDGKDVVIIFDLQNRTWTISRDLFDIARMKAGAYRGLPHKPYVLSEGKGASQSDIYNYLYCIGRVGIDCSGFVWHILSSTAMAGGLDLGKALGKTLKVPRGANPSLFAGTSFFDSRSPELIQVQDRVGSLQPGDILLFRGDRGEAVHSAVIQSVDLASGLIRYLQSTDEAPVEERGVHESWIRFDPTRPELSLKDPSIQWTQRRLPPFSGEKQSIFSNDGERYRAFPEFGAGKAVRLKTMVAPLQKLGVSLRP